MVEVTGHAHVLLAAFEKVSAILPLDPGAMGKGVVFETRSLNLGVTPGQGGSEPEAQGRQKVSQLFQAPGRWCVSGGWAFG